MKSKRIVGNLGYLVAGLVIFSITTTVYIEFKRFPYVKKSFYGVCHSTESPYYDQVKNYESYRDFEGCISSGGRPVEQEDHSKGDCNCRYILTP
tara:strand:- start:1120 stop:1401 length:282 start_codon:yes stop_codon:yes gene_type:complete